MTDVTMATSKDTLPEKEVEMTDADAGRTMFPQTMLANRTSSGEMPVSSDSGLETQPSYQDNREFELEQDNRELQKQLNTLQKTKLRTPGHR